ncbi:hypothetical protein HanIR_Chr03g0106521 [Helianthus annuus]|nr:hypothetical protein HanIR_Chr03g0106521 [Helianthus annuus]
MKIDDNTRSPENRSHWYRTVVDGKPSLNSPGNTGSTELGANRFGIYFLVPFGFV